MEKLLLIFALVIAATGATQDVRTSRIPNWLTYSGLLAALMLRATLLGWPGLKAGLFGLLATGGLFYVLFLLGGMGGGDVKLIAAVGASAGINQALPILICAAIAGGILGLVYALFSRQLRATLLNTFELVRHHVTAGLRPHPVLNIQQPAALRVPYGLAIALGTFYSVGNAFLQG